MDGLANRSGELELDYSAILPVAEVLDRDRLVSVNGSRGQSVAKYGGVGSLSKREIQVCELVCIGLSNGGIAKVLGLETRTVENHMNRILVRVGVPHDRDIHPRVLLVRIYHSGSSNINVPGVGGVDPLPEHVQPLLESSLKVVADWVAGNLNMNNTSVKERVEVAREVVRKWSKGARSTFALDKV